MIDAGCNGLAQHGQCRIAIPGWTKHTGPCELHGAVAKALHAAIAKGDPADWFARDIFDLLLKTTRR